MNYLVAADTFFPDRPGGSERVAWDIAQLMCDRGHNVTVFCRKQSQEAEDFSVYERVQVVRFAFPKVFSLDPFKMEKQRRRGATVARKHLNNMRWDLVHIHTPLYGKIIYEVLGEGPRYVYTVHSPIVMEQEANWRAQGLAGKIKLLFGKGMLKKLEGDLLRKVGRIHTLSEFTKRAIDGYYGVGHKVAVIPHWCKEEYCREFSKAEARIRLGWPKDANTLFSIRRLEPRMGLDVAIKALGPLFKIHPHLFFALAGAGSLERPLKQLAESLGVADKIWFLGQISDDTLKRCYEASDLFVLPTSALECFGLPVLEALACGLPVISTDAAALPELMIPILPDCIVPAGSIEKLRHKFQAYLENRLDLPNSDVLISHVKREYSREIISRHIVELLES